MLKKIWVYGISIEKTQYQTKIENFEQSHSAENCKRGDPLETLKNFRKKKSHEAEKKKKSLRMPEQSKGASALEWFCISLGFGCVK